MTEFSHLDALNANLRHEKIRLSSANTDKEIETRRVWVAQLEKEVKGERSFLGLLDCGLSNKDLLAQLDAYVSIN